MPMVYCRPHVKTITPEMRFVVRTNLGINTGDRVYRMDEEFPADAVSWEWMKLLYDQLKIDLLDEGGPARLAPVADTSANKSTAKPPSPNKAKR